MILIRSLTILFAYILDLIIGDPKNWPHPVKMMGKLIYFLDRKLNHNKRLQGVWMLGLVLLSVATVSLLLVRGAYAIHPWMGVGIESLFIATTFSQKSLKEAAMDVYRPLSENNMPEARAKLAQIVGRDTKHLDESEIIRATIETVIENTTDGITAPLFWAVLGGAPGALLYRAINTCDSMVGYKNETYEQFGWASARLDDVVNWIPARITGVLMLKTLKLKEGAPRISINQLREEAQNHRSPNSGWTEAAIALLLGIQLGGTNYYKGIRSESPKIGTPIRALQKDDIQTAIRSMQRTCFLFLVMSVGGMGLYAFTKTWV